MSHMEAIEGIRHCEAESQSIADLSAGSVAEAILHPDYFVHAWYASS